MFPPEIVLKIVKHLHFPITFRPYERRTALQQFYRIINHVFGENLRENKIQVILEVRKYDPESRNVTTAKNLRLVCSDFASAYDPSYIHTHIGGTFMRKEYSNLLEFNNNLWILPRMTEAAHHYLRGLITGKHGVGKQCDWYSRRSIYLSFPFTLAENILEKNVLLIYNNIYVGNLLSEYYEASQTKARKIFESVNVWVNNILSELHQNRKMYSDSDSVYIPSKRDVPYESVFSKLYPSIMNDRFKKKKYSNQAKEIPIFHVSPLEMLKSRKVKELKVSDSTINNNSKKNNYTEKKLKYEKERKIKKYQNYKPVKGIRR